MYRFAAIVLLALGATAQYSSFQTSKFSAPVMAAPAATFSGNDYSTKTFSAPAIQQTFSAPAVQQTYSAPAVQSYAAPQQAYSGPIEAAVHSRRTVELRTVPIQHTLSQPQIIEVNADHLPVQIHFRSSSSRIQVQQSHTPALVGPVEHTSFQDQPHRLVNEVHKPIIQEVREVIQPYRRVTQEIRPVIEEIHTVVHKGERVATIVADPIVQQPLPLQMASYGSGAALAVNAHYKAAKAAKAAA